MKKISLPSPGERAESRSKSRASFSSRVFFVIFTIFSVAVQTATLKAGNFSDESLFADQSANVFAAEHDLRELKPGETVERGTDGKEIHGYRIILEAGTSVEINIGKRDTPLQLIATVPDNTDFSVPGQKIPTGSELARVAAAAGDELVEPMVIVAGQTGSYLITARFSGPGTYSFSCSAARPASERDRRHAAAGKLFAEIRKLFENGEPPWKMSDKIEERAAIYRSLNDQKSLALSLNDVGLAAGSNAEWGKAFKAYAEGLEIFRALNSVPNILRSLSAIAGISLQMGNYQLAIDKYTEILSIRRLTGDKNGEAGALHQLGVTYHLLADEQKAREYYEQSLLVNRSITNVDANTLNQQAVTLINIGNLYRGVEANEIVMDAFGPRTMDDRRKALEYYKAALEIARRIKKDFPGARHRETYNLLQIGNTYKELENYSEALVYLNQALAGYRTAKAAAGQVYALMGLGNLYALQGEYQKSFENYEQVMQLLKNGADNSYQTSYLNIIAKDYHRAGETQKALAILDEAFTLSRSKEQQIVSTTALFEIARIERELGNFNNARSRIEEAIRLTESVRARMTSQEIRTIYFSSVKRFYDFYVDLLMQAHKSQPEKGFDALALQMSEKARSRSLLDLLAQARVDIKQGVEPRLLERERETREKLSAKAYQQSRLLLGKHTKEEAEKMQAEVTELTGEYGSVQAEIKNKSPRYAALTQPASLDARQIQRLLDSGTILLEYSLGEKNSYLWAVSNDAVASFDLPARAAIETEARRVYELLTARNRDLKGETEERKRARVRAAENEYTESAARLSEKLLGQVASRIGSKRLLIVADGVLNYISFAALPVPKTRESDAGAGQPLGANHEIVTLPSASILALLREENANRKPAPKMLAVFADPVFNQKDARSNFADKTDSKAPDGVPPLKNLRPPSANRDFERAIADLGLSTDAAAGALPRLPFSRREADSIYRLAPRSLSLKETDFDASKANVFGSNLDQYRILHFATHGLLNSRQPELSGIVLSLVDTAGGEIDGFVRLQDIYNLKLAAELVVLSACQTALGKEVKGEGLISLTRGFMYAGSPRVVASLWKVDDAATAELMSVFYRKLLVENLRPAAALRAAQTELMRQPRWKSPYYWAAFTIQGDWR